jgi:hypothetical protein
MQEVNAGDWVHLDINGTDTLAQVRGIMFPLCKLRLLAPVWVEGRRTRYYATHVSNVEPVFSKGVSP